MSRVAGWRVALAFLTRVPVGGTIEASSGLARAVPWLPAVGAAVGVVGAGIYAVGTQVLPQLVAATVAVGATVAVTGAMHEDGLADFADSLGGRSREDALRIMRDPTHGTYGVVALALSLLVRIAALASLDAGQALAALPAAHALGRAGAVVLLAAPAARRSGLGNAWASGLTTTAVMASLAVGALVGGVSTGPWAAPVLAVAAAGVAVVAAVAMWALGGVTGDVMGAAEQAAEILVLLLASALAAAAVPGFPWWR